VVYVDGDRASSGDGASWATAVHSVQEGLDLARCGVLSQPSCEEWQVWVKAGEYRVREGCRFDSVRLRKDVALYGGFAGTEAVLDERDPGIHETVLDGADTQDPDLRAYHVVVGANGAVLDGVTVQNGRAIGPDRHAIGGGNRGPDVGCYGRGFTVRGQ
jgi:hypothetical protein